MCACVAGIPCLINTHNVRISKIHSTVHLCVSGLEMLLELLFFTLCGCGNLNDQPQLVIEVSDRKLMEYLHWTSFRVAANTSAVGCFCLTIYLFVRG